jgi:hypothetical protein
MNEGMENLKEIQDLEERSINPLIRIANALEEILLLVKKDMQKYESSTTSTTTGKYEEI